MVRAEFASIDSSGRLIIRDDTETIDINKTLLPLEESGSHTLAALKKSHATPMWGAGSPRNSRKASVPLHKWVDFYEAKDSVHASLEKLTSRHSHSFGIGHLHGQEPPGHLGNTLYWLERIAGAVAMLKEMRQDHISCLQSSGVLPVGRPASALLAEWASSEAVDILTEAFPELIDQVELYEDTLEVRGRRNRDEDSLRQEVSQLREQVKGEKRQKEYYWRKLREKQQVSSAHNLGFGDFRHNDSTSDDKNMAMYTEEDMQAERAKWQAKLEALDKEWQDRFDAEQRKVWDLELALREAQEEIERLKAELEALQQQLATSSQPAHPAVEMPPADAGGPTIEEPQPPSDDVRVKKLRPSSSIPKASKKVNPEAPTSSISSSSTDMLDGTTGIVVKKPRPNTAPVLSRPEEPRFVAKRWTDNPSGDDQKAKAEELKRRIFENVLNEERKRQQQMDEMEQDALAAKWEMQGQADLTQLLRRIDNHSLRRDLFMLLKNYVKRQHQAMEIVCVYCRRRPRPDQIHSFDVPSSRPASASRVVSVDTTSLLLPKVSSTPLFTMGGQKVGTAFDDPSLRLGGRSELRPPSGKRRPPKTISAVPTPGLPPPGMLMVAPADVPTSIAPLLSGGAADADASGAASIPAGLTAAFATPPGWKHVNADC